MHRLLALLVVTGVGDPVPDATTTKRGYVNTSTQAFSGLKIFDGGIVTPTINGVPVETTAAVTLYLSTTGSDSALCTLAAPCATMTRALALLPKRLSHNVTIEIAAGTYTITDAPTIDGVTMADNVTLTIQGATAWSAWTPASGTATGTLTGFAATTFPARAVFTDSAQSWPAAAMNTVGALGIRGRFLCMTSGLQNGSKFPIHAASPTTLEVGRTSFTGGNPAIGDTYQICTPSTVLTGTGVLLRTVTGTGTIAVNDLAFEGTGTTTVPVVVGGGAGGRSGGYTVNLSRVRVRGFPGSSAVSMQANANCSLSLTDTALLAPVSQEGGNNSTALQLGANTAPVGNSRGNLTDVYMRSQRSVMSLTNAIVAINGVTVDSENVNVNGVVFANGSTISSAVNLWVNCFSGEFTTQSAQSGLSLMLGARASVFSVQVKGCQIGVDLGFAGGSSATPTATPNSFAFSGTTGTLNLTNIGQNTPTTGAGVMLGTGSVLNLRGGTVTFSTVANGARDYVCPNTTTSYTEAAVQAAPDKFVTCQGADLQR